ncbi:hypothetical protein CHUAL_012148 [Chamberlinius hualienensis]
MCSSSTNSNKCQTNISNFESHLETSYTTEQQSNILKVLNEFADDVIKSIESIVSYRFHLTHLLWIHLTRDMEILDWSMQLLPTIANRPSNLYCPLVSKMKELLPKADAYVTEDRSLRIRHLNYVPTLCTTVQIESMLHMLYYRNDRISNEKVVKDLLEGLNSGELRKVFSNDNEIIEWYEKQKSVDKHELGSCLLQAVAFYETQIVLEQADSSDDPISVKPMTASPQFVVMEELFMPAFYCLHFGQTINNIIKTAFLMTLRTWYHTFMDKSSRTTSRQIV